MPELHESPSTEKTWDSFAPPGSTRDKEYARIARQLRYLVGVTIAIVVLLGCSAVFLFWMNLRQIRDEARLAAQQEANKTLAGPQMQESIRHIIDAEVNRVTAKPKTDKSSEHPRTFSDEAAELSEIRDASLDEPANVRFVVSELYSSRPKARELARQLLEQLPASLGQPYDGGYYHPYATPRLRMETINNKDELLSSITEAFYDMKKLTNWNVKMFDVRAANQWCRQHKSICDSDSSAPSSPSQLPKYKVGDRVLVELSAGRIVEATIKAMVDSTDGTRLQVSYGQETALIYLWQIVEDGR